MSRAVRRNRRSVVIDVLAVQRGLQKGTLSERDRATVNRVLPGMFDADGEVVKVSELRSDGQAGRPIPPVRLLADLIRWQQQKQESHG
jgi:hypothetical protein